MPITTIFSTSQVVGSPSEIVITDSSTGSDVTAVSRRVYLVTAAGQWLTANGLSSTIAYTDWPLASGSTLTLDVLDNDMALDITLSYVNISGVSVSSDTQLCGFTLYNETFYYSLTQAQASQNQPPPMILQDTNYYNNKMMLRVNIDSGNQAITLGDDITSVQNMYDLATFMVSQQNLFF